MRNVHRLLVLAAIALIGDGAALRAQIKPTATLSGSAPAAYKLAAPASLTATQIAPGVLQLSWSAVSGASAYVVSGPGIAPAGMTVTGTTTAISGVQSPGMLTFKVVATAPMSVGTMAGAPATQGIWVRGTMSGLVTPSLPTPSFQLKGVNKTEGATNDEQGILAQTSLNLNQNPQSCPYTPMFYYDAAQSPIPAAAFYIVEPDSDPAYEKYTIIAGGNTYFRAPTFPGLKYVPPPKYNAWVFIVDCHGAYSNALQFHVYPTDFQLLSANSMVCQNHQWVNQYGKWPGAANNIPATQAGQQFTLLGTGFAGEFSTTDEKVYFHLQGPGGPNGQPTIRDVQAFPAFAGAFNERQLNVVSPDPSSVGLNAVQQATVYVTRSGNTSASLPISYGVTNTVPVAGMSAC